MARRYTLIWISALNAKSTAVFRIRKKKPINVPHMQKVQEIAKAMNIIPKLRLGNKIVKDGKDGGVESTGPHTVKFVAEPVVVMGKDDKGVARKELRFEVEEGGKRFYWKFPLLNKEGQPNYLIERTMNLEVGDMRILEMIRVRGRNYIDVRHTDAAPTEPEEDELEIPVVEGEEGKIVSEAELENAGLGGDVTSGNEQKK